MLVPMMNVRRVGVTVGEGCVRVSMRMRLATRIVGRVRMLVMFVVHVAMRVLQRFVHVNVFVALREMQPESDGHQRRRGEDERRDPIVPKQ